MYKKFLLLSLLPALVLSEVKEIYVVDVQRVIDESELGKKSKASLEQEVKQREASFQKKAKAFEGEVSSFEKQRASLSPQAAKERAEGLAKRESELRREARTDQEQYARKQEAELEALYSKISAATKKVAKEENYDFVVEKNRLFVVWVDSEYDITDKVIKEMNR